MRRPLQLAALLVVLAFPAAAHAAPRPNVVVIETDDQTAADMASMPRTRALIGDQGVTFDNSFVSLSQCCPSRATFLTGQYAHNHGVRTTQPPFGGFPAFKDDQSLPVWLQRAGYATALVGKYFNGYGKDDPTYVPPGWTDWHGLEGPTTYSFSGFALNDNGRVARYPGSYQTDVLTRLSQDFVRRQARARQPFFLWTTVVDPHIGGPHHMLDGPRTDMAVPSPLFYDALLGAQMPMSPAFDEADVSDKPAALRNRRRLGPHELMELQLAWQRRQESLLAVDLDVRKIVGTLRHEGVLRNTLLIFTSDNGYLIGEHRVRESKVLPYEPSIRVPLMLRGPGVPKGASRSQLAFNGDLAPTILQATGAQAPWATDGMSLLPFARHATTASRRAILLEGPPQGNRDGAPRFTGLRTTRYAYVEYRDGEVELYDLRRDPDELRNLAGQPAVAALQARLARRLASLRHCSGPDCRR
jgi:N-acetylglucosamine-6-sulfatase